MTDANRVPAPGSSSLEDTVVRIVDAQVSALRVQLAVLAEAVRLLPPSDRRSAVHEIVEALAHNLGTLAGRLRRTDHTR